MKKSMVLLTAIAIVGAGLVAPGAATAEVLATQIDLQPENTQQTIDGFGYSAAFQRTHQLNQLSDAKKAEAVELLLGDSGVDPSILRLGIGGQSTAPYDRMLSIQPTDPGGPTAAPNYQWDGYDNGQVWFAQAAAENGVEYIYGNAWTAPGYMKTNNSPTNGGTLCGLAGATCASGDWTDAYADYLVAWADFYKQEGVEIDGIGFANEPDYTSNYESMRLTPAQAVEFVRTAGPVFDASGYDLLCCEAFGWNQGKNYHSAIQEDGEASKWVDVLTAHSYASRSDSPHETDKPLWMSEWAASTSGLTEFNANWDSPSPAGSDGIKMVDHMMDTLTLANATGYLWWLGVSQGASGSLMVVDVANDTFTVGSRLYAMSAFSRFIRPDAVRFDAVHAIPDLKVAAFENADGTQTIQLLNNGTTAITTDVDLAVEPTAYLNDQSNRLIETEGIATTAAGKTDLQLPARSLVTLVVPADEPDGEGIPIEATVPEPTGPGTLSLTVADFGDGVELGGAANAGDRIRFTGELPEITVADTRNGDQAGAGGWQVSGQSTALTSDAGSLGAEHLGWSPEVLTPRPGLTAGAAVSTALDDGPGLSTAASLASADAAGRFGTADLTADLLLEVPVGTDPGTYRGAVTVSLFPVD